MAIKKQDNNKEPRNNSAVLYVRGLGVWVTYVIIVTHLRKNKHKKSKNLFKIY